MDDSNHARRDCKEEPPLESGSRGAGVPPAVFLPIGASLKVRSRRLPHWEVERAVYFVAFRLADSLPKHALQKLDLERKDILGTASQMGRGLSTPERKRIEQLRARRVEGILDSGAGKCFLGNPAIAQVVVIALKEFDGSRYRLFWWAVMPNHVHVLFQMVGEVPLAGILHSWKSFSAKEANRKLGRSGQFWQQEYYDHLIRNANEFERALTYIEENPSKAGLVNWPWVWSWK